MNNKTSTWQANGFEFAKVGEKVYISMDDFNKTLGLLQNMLTGEPKYINVGDSDHNDFVEIIPGMEDEKCTFEIL